MDQFSELNNKTSEKSALQQFAEICNNSTLISSSASYNSPNNYPNTVYDEKEPLNDTQISEIWGSLPYLLQKSIKKERKGELKSVTVEELQKIREQYFNSPN